MPNKTKAEIRHAKLSAKAENAARKSLKNDKGLNKNLRLVTKANKLNKRKNLGKDDIAYGMSPYKHSGTKKHNKKHSENPNWKHKDRSAGAIIGRAVNTVKEGVNKGIEEGGKIIKDAKETIKAGNKMSPYKFKPVPADKQKSLGKLPTEVRNKMGYEMKPGFQMSYKMVNKQGLKMAGNPAMKFDTNTDPNLSLMNDPDLSGLDLPDTGDNVNFEGENMNVLGVDVNKIFKNETTYTPPTRTAEGDAWYASLTPEERAFYDNKYIKENTKPTGNKVLDSFNAVVNLGGIPQPGTPEVKGDAFTTYDKRQRRRGILFEDNAIKRAESKLGRTTARQDYLDTKRKNVADIADARKTKKDKLKQIKNTDFNAIATASDLLSGQKGLSGKQLKKLAKQQARKDYKGTRNQAVENIAKGLKDKKQKSKDARLTAKQSANQSTVDRLKAVREISKKQEQQAVNPDLNRSNAVILQQGSQGSSSTPAKSGAKNCNEAYDRY